MNQNNVREGIENIVRESIKEIDDNLKAIGARGERPGQHSLFGLCPITANLIKVSINLVLMEEFEAKKESESCCCSYRTTKGRCYTCPEQEEHDPDLD